MLWHPNYMKGHETCKVYHDLTWCAKREFWYPVFMSCPQTIWNCNYWWTKDFPSLIPYRTKIPHTTILKHKEIANTQLTWYKFVTFWWHCRWACWCVNRTCSRLDYQWNHRRKENVNISYIQMFILAMTLGTLQIKGLTSNSSRAEDNFCFSSNLTSSNLNREIHYKVS